MEIQSELPADFDELSDSKKLEELEALIDRIDEDTEAGALKKRMLEELAEEYRN